MLKIAFLDRDGTLIHDYPDDHWQNVKEPDLLPGTIEGLSGLATLGFQFIIITNQYLIADGIIQEEDYQVFHTKLLNIFKQSGIHILHTYHCPHNDGDMCSCKKPKTGMVEQAMEDFPIDMASSIYCGDSPCDYLLAQRLMLPFFGIQYQGQEKDVKRCHSLMDVLRHLL